MPWYVYLIECTNGSLYTGISNDVAARFRAHLSGKGARYTRANPPRRLMAVIAQADRASASRAEHAIKQLSAPQKRALCAEHPVPAELIAELHTAAATSDR
ncbi:GIY-YIG nuclease family protein [Jeongeupia naejangsanensis]|uniref:GIY-YIG nuclease family protein n=1 Tax=Jeongeupia naejangsanensis TaxID=613195 RepID=A0ABS2BHA5_9NEIS|nr:GIY-YIG nuclease family protein [Jeongeupia naejangsanensis]MBM3114321.1 GIY-YIG nuclease family protein [Jeongeupia naejangsanensis]